MTEPGAGRDATPAEVALAELAKRFTPDKQLQFLQDTASRVLTHTALIGTALGAGGLVALSTIVANPASFWWTVAAVGGSLLAILLALSTQVTVLRKIRVGDLIEIKKWYERYRGWRGVFLSAATWVLLAAFICAVVAVAIGLSSRSGSPAFDVTATVTPAAEPEPGEEPASDTHAVKVNFSVQPEGADDVLTLTVESGGEVWATTQKHATGEAAITVALEAAGLPTEDAVEVTGESNSWTCTATITDATVTHSGCTKKSGPEEDEG